MDWGNAILAGLVAAAVMTVLMYLRKTMGMPMDMPRMLGLMFVGPGSSGAVGRALIALVASRLRPRL